jgi:2-polyprenyl-6-methoxyphenol hydroxylase-like FAD-dependent oxidoreductase
MRANLFVYRDSKDLWLREMRTHPQETIYSMWPSLRHIMGEFSVEGPVQIRPIDLYLSRGHLRAGIVLVGDAFSTSCPAAGTGARKVLVDVERLCNVHIPQWLNTPGMDVAKISTFYDDPAKKESDAFALDKAFAVRAFATSGALGWRARRGAKFLLQLMVGAVRQFRQHQPPAATDIISASDVTLVPSDNVSEHPERIRLDA